MDMLHKSREAHKHTDHGENKHSNGSTAFQLWFDTSAVEHHYLERKACDVRVLDSEVSLDPRFRVELFFRPVPD